MKQCPASVSGDCRRCHGPCIDLPSRTDEGRSSRRGGRSPGGGMSIGLRERKKLKTRAAIQKEALRLFLEKGYEATTIEDIAEAVEISPSTFFNYFPSKEAVVFQDDLDPVIFAAFNAQPADVSPITALRNA